MLILLSPAKTLDMETPSRVDEPSQPDFMTESGQLVSSLRRYSKNTLGDLMKISESLAELNLERFQAWQPPFDVTNARPAIQAFRGDVYIGLDADSLKSQDLEFAQQHLRILSGLYGVLRPLDLIQAYRLEMGTSLKTRRGRNLYQFWGERITQSLNDKLQGMEQAAVINLASNEYFKSVKPKQLAAPLITPVFKDEKNGDYKVISFFAKKARGAMARHLIVSRARERAAVESFDSLGYRFDASQSTADKPVFLRSENAARPYLA